MNREQQINDAIALLEDAIKKGEIEQKFCEGEWYTETVSMLIDRDQYKYRAKHDPAEFWINEYSDRGTGYYAHLTKTDADNECRRFGGKRIRCIHVREVTDE